MWAGFQCKKALAWSLTVDCVWPGTKQSTQFKHFSECFLANTVHFVMLEYFVNHCDLEWFYSPCPSVAAIIFFFTVLITEGNYSNSCMCCQALPVCVQATWLCSTVDPLVIAYIAFAWPCQIKSSVLVGKCYKRSQHIVVLHHTPGRQYCYFYVFHCHGNILIHPLCLFACSFFKIPTFSRFVLWLNLRFFCVWFCSRVLFLNVYFHLLSASSQYRYIPHNPWQSRRRPLWNGPGSRATVNIINGTLSLDLDVICQKQFQWKMAVLFHCEIMKHNKMFYISS